MNNCAACKRPMLRPRVFRSNGNAKDSQEVELCAACFASATEISHVIRAFAGRIAIDMAGRDFVATDLVFDDVRKAVIDSVEVAE